MNMATKRNPEEKEKWCQRRKRNKDNISGMVETAGRETAQIKDEVDHYGVKNDPILYALDRHGIL